MLKLSSALQSETVGQISEVKLNAMPCWMMEWSSEIDNLYDDNLLCSFKDIYKINHCKNQAYA